MQQLETAAHDAGLTIEQFCAQVIQPPPVAPTATTVRLAPATEPGPATSTRPVDGTTKTGKGNGKGESKDAPKGKPDKTKNGKGAPPSSP
jgi:hypothetical protein